MTLSSQHSVLIYSNEVIGRIITRALCRLKINDSLWYKVFTTTQAIYLRKPNFSFQFCHNTNHSSVVSFSLQNHQRPSICKLHIARQNQLIMLMLQKNKTHLATRKM